MRIFINAFNRRSAALVAGFLAIFALTCSQYTHIEASSGLTVTGALLVTNVSPGQILNHSIIVEIGDENKITSVDAQVYSIEQSLDGTLNTSAKNEEFFSAASYITLDKYSLQIVTGKPSTIIATINIPDNPGTGGKYALVTIKTKASGQGNVGVVNAINVPIFLTIKDSQLIHTGKITSITSSEASNGEPVIISITLKNTGNHHYKIKSETTIRDNTGKFIDKVYTAPTSSLIPTMSREIKTTYIPKSDLPVGTYNVKSKVMLEDGTLLDEATGSFEVKEPYVPPPAPASITVKPDSASTLQAEDGRIAINFPAGSVLGQANLALRSYPPEQLPSPPTGYTSGTTAFRVDGLNGLLAKPATLKVQYSSADVEKAAMGQDNRLVLARWDESSNQWVIAKTKVDSATMSLTAETNQFGLWAVMAAPPTAGINWTIIGSIIALVVIVVILGVFFRPRKKKTAN